VERVDPGAFVGREREMEQLLAGLEDAEAGRGRLFLLAGEPGIGKSRLAHEIAARALGQRARVLWGRCWEGGGAPAFWPWIQCLRSYLRDTEGEAIPPFDSEGAALLAELIPEFGRRIPAPLGSSSLEPQVARFRLFDSVTSFLLEAGRARPLLVVLDDIHAADAPSLALLTHASRAIQVGPVMVLGCYRDTEVLPGHPFASALGDIARQGGASSISLVGLSGDEVARYLEAETGSRPDPSLVALVRTRSEGNPLFMVEVARMLLHQGDATVPTSIPGGLEQAIERRLGLISPRCREVLTAASAFGSDVGLVPLARLTAAGREELLALVDESIRARLLEEVPGTLGKWRFAHGLVRDALYDQLAPSERMRLHGRIGSVLESLYADDPDPHLAEIAHHYVRAAPGGNPALAADYARRAGDRALRVLAHEEAARLYETAVRVLDLQEHVDPAERCDLLLALGEAWSRAGQRSAFQEAFLNAADVARRHGMWDRLARAALGYGGRHVWGGPGGDAQLIPLLEEGLQAVGEADPVLRAGLLARLAGALRDHSPERAEGLSAAAVELARRADDLRTLAWTLTMRRLILWGPGQPDEAQALSEELVRLADESGDPERALEAHALRLESRLMAGDVAGVREDLDQASRAAEAVPLPSARWHILVHRSELALLEGRFEDAEDLIARGRALGTWDASGDAAAGLTAQEFLLRRERGGLEEIVADIERVAKEHTARPLFQCVLADMFAELGREGEVRAAFEPLAANDFAAIPRNLAWMLSIALLSGVVAFLRDAPKAAILHALLLPFKDLNVIDPHEFSAGAASRYLGLLDEVLGRDEEAVEHFERALRMNEQMGARPWLAHTQHDLARVLLQSDDPGDRDLASGLVATALATARELGMTTLEARLIRQVEMAPAAPREAATVQRRSAFRREGEYWTIAFEGDAFRLHDSKGLHYMARLLAAPGREFHALDLVGAEEGANPERARIGDAGEVLDQQAKAAYRRRLEELREDVEEAEGYNDPERAARAREEMEFLAHELARATGLGGRDRKAASASERARVNVTRAIRAALARIAEHSPDLGRHLDSTVRTGTFCSYVPDPRLPPAWHL
jgi:tetratricopeptide (TPR) repeat protein